MTVPGLGELKAHVFRSYCSDPIPIAMFGGKSCRIVLDGYDKAARKEDFHVAIANFLSGSPAILREADEPLFRYYKTLEGWWLKSGHRPIASADELWRHVQFGDEAWVVRRAHGDKGIYVSVECNCDWEEEHGLQLVLKNGSKVNKLGGHDGHLTNSDAYGDDSLEHVIYC